MDHSVQVELLNGKGENIFFLEGSGYEYEMVKLYYYNSELNYVRLYDKRLGNPDYLDLTGDGKLEILTVFGEMDGTFVKGGRSTTYIDFGNGDIDTLQVSGPKRGSSKIVHDVWYNGQHVADLSNCCSVSYTKEL